MLIKIIHRDAEQKLLTFVEQSNQHNITWGALYFNSSKLSLTPTEEDILLTVKHVLEEHPSAIYFFGDGDIVITWSGAQKATLDNLTSKLYDRYGYTTEENLLRYYDMQAQGEEFRLICKRKMMEAQPVEKPVQPADAHPVLPDTWLQPASVQVATFQTAAQERKRRFRPEILIVEDQIFSSKLLQGMLDKNYKTYDAADAQEAMRIYIKRAPDIVFLDIELPGTSGHQFAAMIHNLDPQAYIVMVTGNNHADDVIKAKENGAKGFIVKPYNKQKILEAVQKYLNERPSK